MGRRIADVTQTEDADHPLALVDHRQPAHLQLLHVPRRLGEVIIIPATMDAWGHHIACRCAAGIEALLPDAFVHRVFDFHGRPPLLKLAYQPRFPRPFNYTTDRSSAMGRSRSSSRTRL